MKLRFKYLSLSICLVIGSLTSCQKDGLMDDFTAKDGLEITTRIVPMDKIETRATIDRQGKGQFEEGDLIEMWITTAEQTTSQQELTLTGGKWTPSLSWHKLNTSSARFTAIYPQSQDGKLDSFTHSVYLDQTTEEAYTQSDLLWATTEVTAKQPVELAFRHAQSLVEVNLKSDESFTKDDLAKATMFIKGHTNLRYDVATQQFSLAEGEVQSVKMQSVGNGTFRAILPSQAILQDWYNTSWLTIECGGKTLQYKAPQTLNTGMDFSSLESGKKVTFNLLLKKGKEPEKDWANQTVWVHGVKNPPINQWGYSYIDPYKVIGLEWEPSYGWFDVNKLDPTGPTYGDHNMCWAATASNMIYWWLAQNKTNIEKYGKYTGPNKYINSRECDVFEFFKKHFADKGNFIHGGLEWFLRGRPVNGTDNPSLGNHKGFFNEVLLEYAPRITTGRLLDEDFKQSLQAKEAIGLSILVHNGRSGHAITAWGADFDENGELCAIYITENNDIHMELYQGVSPMRPQELCPIGLYPKNVRKQSNGDWYMESGVQGKFTIPITEVTFLSLKEKEWKEYFQRTNGK